MTEVKQTQCARANYRICQKAQNALKIASITDWAKEAAREVQSGRKLWPDWSPHTNKRNA
jgi:hypothetical protein